MKRVFKIFSISLIVSALFLSAVVFSACRGGASNPERAARNFINAMSSQNSDRIAAVLGLEDEELEEFLSEWEDRHTAPDPNDDIANRNFQRRQDEFRSLRFVSLTGLPAIPAAATTVSGTATFSFVYLNRLADPIEVERTVRLQFWREEDGSRWFSNRANIEALENAMMADRN